MGTIKIVDQKRCTEEFPGIDGSKMCAGLTSMSACYGDSGGPMFICNRQETECIQIGIASAVSRRCDVTGVSVIYSRVTSFQEWIETEQLCN